MSTALRLVVLLVIGTAFLFLLLTAWVGEAVADSSRRIRLGHGPSSAEILATANPDGEGRKRRRP